MTNKGNPGILVDETVSRLVDAKINFKALRPVKAKGYAREVLIFVPLEKISSANRKFIGRKEKIQQILDHAVVTMRNIDPDDLNSKCNRKNGKISFITGGSGLRKNLAANTTARSLDKYAVFFNSISNESEQLVPLNVSRTVFLDMLRDFND